MILKEQAEEFASKWLFVWKGLFVDEGSFEKKSLTNRSNFLYGVQCLAKVLNLPLIH